jgi:hydrogenase expression/formation protein HypE
MSGEGVDGRILLTHGSGGLAARDLVRDRIVRIFDNAALDLLEDASPVELAAGEGSSCRLVMTTDSFVVTPLFFPGGDIGKLAVCGTVNDLATAGAKPLALSVGLILEEGLPLSSLDRILESMKRTADDVPVPLITGDTKVVEKGRGDSIYINTTGIGRVPPGIALSQLAVREGDAVLVNGPIGNHEAAIYASRGDFSMGAEITSDCAALSRLMEKVLAAVPRVKCARDATRGGVAAVLTEIGEMSGCTILLDEQEIPVEPPVQALCDVLGLDPLFMANEGRMIIFAAREDERRCLEVMRSVPGGEESRKIGEVTAGPGKGTRAFASPRLVMRTLYGTSRIVTLPAGSQLPRIC